MGVQPTGKRLAGFFFYYGAMLLAGLAAGIIGYKVTDASIFSSYIIGTSMNPTLQEDEYTLGIRFGWLRPKLERGDIINFYPPVDSNGMLYSKRVIGLPGETVLVEEGEIYINGAKEPLEEPYLGEEWTVEAGPYYFEVPEGHYLVMGDNRNDSYDSRDWEDPYVDYGSIRSKTLVVYKPVSCIRYLY